MPLPPLATLQAFRSGNASIPLEGGGTLQVLLSAAGAFTNPQPASLQGTILVDPQNASGQANDGDPPTITFAGFTGPCFRTYAGLVAAWGTNTPYLTQPTTAVSVSSHVDNTDPVVIRPLLGRGGTWNVQGAAPVVVSPGVVLSGVTAKNRSAGANSLLQATLGGGVAVGHLVENLTHPSRAWVYKALGAGAFSLTQPLTKTAIGQTTLPSEVDTWANGDVVNVLAPIAINIVDIEPTIADYPTGTFPSPCTIFQCTILDPSGVNATNAVNIGVGVALQEVFCQRTVNALAGVFGSSQQTAAALDLPAATNVNMAGGLNALSPLQCFGGCTSGLTVSNINTGANAAGFDGDFIFGGLAWTILGGIVDIGVAFLDSNMSMRDGEIAFQNFLLGSHVLYGAAGKNINVAGGSHFTNVSGTFVAGFTAPALVTGIQINGSTTASSHTAADPDVIHSATTTPAHFDAASGAGTGLGGNGFQLGGASVSQVL